MPQPRRFECRLYIPDHQRILPRLPRESGPQRLATFAPVDQTKLVEPAFRRLILALELVTN